MSANNFDIVESPVEDSFDSEDPDPLGDLVPKLVQTRTAQASGTFQGRGEDTEFVITEREFAPLVVTRLGGTLPWDTESEQLLCGETVTDTTGDMNIRINYECVCSHSEFQTLQQMRQNPTEIRLVSAPYTGPVTFDQLKFDQIEDSNGAIVRGEGLNNEPMYEVQLQSKEDSQNS